MKSRIRFRTADGKLISVAETVRLTGCRAAVLYAWRRRICKRRRWKVLSVKHVYRMMTAYGSLDRPDLYPWPPKENSPTL